MTLGGPGTVGPKKEPTVPGPPRVIFREPANRCRVHTLLVGIRMQDGRTPTCSSTTSIGIDRKLLWIKASAK